MYKLFTDLHWIWVTGHHLRSWWRVILCQTVRRIENILVKFSSCLGISVDPYWYWGLGFFLVYGGMVYCWLINMKGGRLSMKDGSGGGGIYNVSLWKILLVFWLWLFVSRFWDFSFSFWLGGWGFKGFWGIWCWGGEDIYLSMKMNWNLSSPCCCFIQWNHWSLWRGGFMWIWNFLPLCLCLDIFDTTLWGLEEGEIY